MVLSYATAVGSIGLAAKMAYDTIKNDAGAASLLTRSVITTALVFCFFQVFPHYPVGVSEVHFILGSTLFLMFGAGPAAIGLALGLLAQGVLFAPADLPQYGMNVTTLIVPLICHEFPGEEDHSGAHTAYKDVKYTQALALSTSYQGGIVAWVAFWAFYGSGFGAESLAQVGSFGLAYMAVIVVEPFLDLAVLAAAKGLDQFQHSKLFNRRLYQAARLIADGLRHHCRRPISNDCRDCAGNDQP